MSKAFIETTILTDYLLKRDGSEARAKDLIDQYDVAVIPQFSWKEFKRGPLNAFVWAHNKLVETKSITQTFAALQRMSRSPKRYFTSTAIQSIHTAISSEFSELTGSEIENIYGPVKIDEIIADVFRVELKKVISRSWGARLSLFDGIEGRLSCYPDVELEENGGILINKPIDCPSSTECCLKIFLLNNKIKLEIVRKSLDSAPDKKETIDRKAVIRQIEKHPSSIMTNKDCRKFGDAYFVLFCPIDHEILTTNIADIKPMADALGVNFACPGGDVS